MCWSWNRNRWWRPSNTARRRRKETDPFWLILCPCPRLLWRTEYSRPQKQAPDTKNSSPAKKPSIWRSSVPLASWIPVKNRFQRSRDCDLFSVCFFFICKDWTASSFIFDHVTYNWTIKVSIILKISCNWETMFYHNLWYFFSSL